MSGLEYLGLFYNQVSDITPLSNLTRLEVLDIAENEISGSSDALLGLTELRTIELYHNQFTDLSGLANASALTQVVAWSNTISDLEGLGGQSTLRQLNVSSNPITSLAPLLGHTALETVEVDRTSVDVTEPAMQELIDRGVCVMTNTVACRE